MRKTDTLVVGASISGLATAACLQNKSIDYIIIEKQSEVAAPWRNHYDRLHLHTNKRISHLPFKKFAHAIPRYPSRNQVVKYLEEYQMEYGIKPVFDTEAKSIRKDGCNWITETDNETFLSEHVVVATGSFCKSRPIDFPGIESFTGSVMHSSQYTTGQKFKGQKVLVVGFGNSACEIAIDLYEQGAMPSMSVRSPVNILPRDLLGVPILELSLLLSKLPARVADMFNMPVTGFLFSDLNKLGLKKMQTGPFETIVKYGIAPVLDIGTVKHIRQGHISIKKAIDHIDRQTIYFSDGSREDFDVIVAAIGYYNNCSEIIHVDQSRFQDLTVSVDKQKYFGKDGLYFCGFWIAPTGQIREISMDAQKIAKDIAIKKACC
ncbi:MAG: NAD(P)/FAD-dependent oxidoreductase [Ferruginibacter sp.]